jgi:TPR repeat protein
MFHPGAPVAGLDIGTAEQIKWWDVLDSLKKAAHGTVTAELQMALECQHPDAQWLASLFPAGEPVSVARMRAVMLEKIEDPRAMFFASVFTKVPNEDTALWLMRSAKLGYAPAQAHLASLTSRPSRFKWMERAAAQGDRHAMFLLGGVLYRGQNFQRGQSFKVDVARGTELFGRAAALGHPQAAFYYGEAAYDHFDWERYYWWGRSALRGVFERPLLESLLRLDGFFKDGQCGRILHTAAPVIRKGFDAARRSWFGGRLSDTEAETLTGLLCMHEALLGRARAAIMCWSAAGRRLGVAKDIRVMIAKLAWEEAWQWGELQGTA